MDSFYSIIIDKKSEVPLYQQLAEGLCHMIEQGILVANSKLPPIRQMASQLHVNAVTVVAAYKYLEQKKVVYSLVGSGTYVSPLPIEKMPEPLIFPSVDVQKQYSIEGAINFVDSSIPQSLFPVEEFKDAFYTVLEREQGNAFRYLDSMGYFPLREILCEYLKEYTIHASAENIQIISGAQQGIDIISKALVNYGDTIFTEKPTFYGACATFMSRGGNVIGINMEKNGIDTLELENLLKVYHPKFLYIMAYFQTPTGISYSTSKKRKLLELAEKYHFYIIEDDNLYDFYYGKEKIIPLKALDYKNKVIYIKSFSKIWMPGLRMGFMLLPKKLLESVRSAKYTTDISTSGFLQKGVEYYLKKYGWKHHSEIMRKYGGEQYRMAVSAVKKHLAEKVSFLLPKGGISLWLKLPPNVEAEQLCTLLLQQKVIVSPSTQYYMGQKENNENIRICFSNVKQRELEEGMKKINLVIERLQNAP